jgi:Xaa-Pro aminopeptidase
MIPATAENVGPHFAIDRMLQARQMSWDALTAIVAQITPGMTEPVARSLARQTLREAGMERLWHPCIIRFGANTLKTFRQVSAPDTVLGEQDLFFIDLGPVFDGHEGDVGDTFVVGDDPLMRDCAEAARELFRRVAAKWKNERCSGQALYTYADNQAQGMGWRLNHETKGHRVGDFPHSAHKAGTLGKFPDPPVPGLWILEIQIAHRERPIGAFYEDLLIAS